MNYEYFMKLINESNYLDWINNDKTRILKSNMNISINIQEDENKECLDESWIKKITHHDTASIQNINLMFNNIIVKTIPVALIDGNRCYFPLPNINNEFSDEDCNICRILSSEDTLALYMGSFYYLIK